MGRLEVKGIRKGGMVAADAEYRFFNSANVQKQNVGIQEKVESLRFAKKYCETDVGGVRLVDVASRSGQCEYKQAGPYLLDLYGEPPDGVLGKPGIGSVRARSTEQLGIVWHRSLAGYFNPVDE